MMTNNLFLLEILKAKYIEVLLKRARLKRILRFKELNFLLVPTLNEYTDAKKTVRCKRVLITSVCLRMYAQYNTPNCHYAGFILFF